jgi:integrase
VFDGGREVGRISPGKQPRRWFWGVSPNAFSAEWRDVADGIGLTGIPLHSLRDTRASELIDAGIDVVTISKRLGHASPAITLKIYAHLFRKHDGEASAAINAALSGPRKS